MLNTRVEKERWFSHTFALSRILNSGVIMSIERNEKELKGLEKSIKMITNTEYVSLFNSYTGAVHAALWGQDIVHGSSTRLHNASETEKKFLKWLGLNLEEDSSVHLGFERISINWDVIGNIDELVLQKKNNAIPFVLDFTNLGFGPCAALAVNDQKNWKKAERLKIFGAFDLRTMWTQEESEPDIQPAIQFNYRLSPLVAACIKLSLLRRQYEN